MEHVWGTICAHVVSCSADPQAPLSSVDPDTMAVLSWLNHLWATAHEWGDDSNSWSSQQQSITAAHTQLDAVFCLAPTWDAYLLAYERCLCERYDWKSPPVRAWARKRPGRLQKFDPLRSWSLAISPTQSHAARGRGRRNLVDVARR